MYLCARGIDSVQSLDSKWRCTCVRGVLILYKAWIVSGDVLVCEGLYKAWIVNGDVLV
jgi:hypothetical protein